MITNHTEETLIKFEERVCDTFMNKEILAPVHLYSGNEKKMIEISSNPFWVILKFIQQQLFLQQSQL